MSDIARFKKHVNIHRTDGRDRYGSIHFTLEHELKESEALELQEELGWHPSGYGFYSFEVNKGLTTWNCSASCD